VLLILLAGVMGYGTYVETALSNGAARILVYKTWWFDTLLALVALNLIGCIATARVPRREFRGRCSFILHSKEVSCSGH
jgi:hypothetical protein